MVPDGSGRNIFVSIRDVTRKESKVLCQIAMGDTLGPRNSDEE